VSEGHGYPLVYLYMIMMSPIVGSINFLFKFIFLQ
jgi:hypothetical protein